MDAAIGAAIIGGGAVIVAAILPLLRKHNGKKVETKDLPVPSNATVEGEGVAVAVAVGGSGNVINVHAKSTDKPARLEIVDVEILDPENGFPFADIKVRNVGDEPVYIKKILLEITHCFIPREYRSIHHSMQPITWEYDLLLSGGCELIEKSVSQVVKPKDTDRFAIRIAQKVSPPDLPILVRFNLSLLYDGEKDSKYEPALIALVPSTLEVYGSYTSECDEGLRIWNIEEINKFSTLPGKVSEAAREQFDAVSDAQ